MSISLKVDTNNDKPALLPWLDSFDDDTSLLLTSNPITLDDVTGLQDVKLSIAKQLSKSKASQDSITSVPSEKGAPEDELSRLCIYWRWGSESKLWRYIDIYSMCYFVNNTEHTLELGSCAADAPDHEDDISCNIFLQPGTREPCNVQLEKRRFFVRLTDTSWSAQLSTDGNLFIKMFHCLCSNLLKR